MKIWAISDIHFSEGLNSSMSAFGPIWKNHPEKIVTNWRDCVGPSDLVLLAGDLSWVKTFEKGLVFLRQLSALPGKNKIIIPGNHDIWWTDDQKIKKMAPKSIVPLHGSAVKIENQVFCGTCGWHAPNDPHFDNFDRKFFDIEMQLLRNSLEEATKLEPEQGIHVLLHFPPFSSLGEKTLFFDLLKEYPVTSCIFGHFHLKEEWDKTPLGKIDGINCYLTSSDFLAHRPIEIKTL